MIRSAKPSTAEPALQWQTIYCSLMLLLVVFFIMLIAYSTIDKNRLQRAKDMAGMERAIPTKATRMDRAMRSLQALTVQLGMESDFAIVRTPDGFKAVVPNPVLFRSGDASLNEAISAILDGIIAIAKHNDLLIQVEGHTDNQPIETTRFPSNWELSTMRAVNILRYLQDKGEIPRDRLAAVGFGEYHPIADNDTPEGRQKNRRIEIIFKPGL